ncbi:MAG: hypothetical protein ABIP06_07160 [Pyrinomonadaceae bacterium]
MKEICLDEGTIQAFLDGELGNAQMENATRHIALCNDCALLLSAAEEESAFAFSALDGDLNMLVPTQRLWSKINDSIVEEKRKGAFWYNFTSFVSNLSRPSVAAFASLLIVFAVFSALLISRPNSTIELVKETSPNIPEKVLLPAESKTIIPPAVTANENQANFSENTTDEPTSSTPTLVKARPISSKNEIVSAAKADYRKAVPVLNTDSKAAKKSLASAPQFLPGEETYIRTISNLSETVSSQKDTAMKPSARFAYEKDLAVINDAIDKMKQEVKKNPKNEAAKDILYASYQNKINLLNSVTERTELMVSIR